MTTEQALNKLCSDVAAVNLQTLTMTESQQDPEPMFTFTTTAQPVIHVMNGKVLCTLYFEDEDEYDDFLDSLDAMDQLIVPVNAERLDVITITPLNDKDDHVIYASGYIGTFVHDDNEQSVDFMFSDQEFGLFSMDTSKVQ